MRAQYLLLASLLLAACGDDDAGGGGGKGSGSQSAAEKKKTADAKKKQQAIDKVAKDKERRMEAISFIPTLEKVVPPDEAPTIRGRLKDRDFEPDPSGIDNRDPWRSYTLPQVIEQPTTSLPAAGTAKPSNACPKEKLVATEYSLRDLSLLGIVTRGVQHFALFRDSKGVGHVVERGKCIGREKGLVTEIGDGFVSGVITPEILPNGTVPDATPFTIPLYTTELSSDQSQGEEVGAGDNSAAAPLPPPTMTPTAPPPTMNPSPPPAEQPSPTP
jgi:hypothetical protein